MKTAFKILPPASEELTLHLLIQAGWEGVSFVYYAKNPLQLVALYIYHFDKNITAIEMADELTLFFKEKDLPGYESCHICYNFKESTMVPTPFYKENMQSQMLDIIYSTNNMATCYAQKVNDANMYNLYRVNSLVEAALQQEYPSAQTHHSSSLQMEALKEKADLIYCTVYQNSIKVFVFKDTNLQIVQFFDYTTPADVGYHLLNICQQHAMPPNQVTLMLSGFIDKKSNLYDELHRYFLDIQLQDTGLPVALAVSQYPVHFFSHLILLVKCVS